jgi:hypothetical protein
MTYPTTVTHQERLLGVDSNASKFLEGLLHPGISVHPLFLDACNGVWVLRVKFAPGVTVPMHFHTGTVHVYTMSGCWYYSEHPDEKQTAGCYLYEPGGSVHQFNTPLDNAEVTDTFMVVTGANVNFASVGGAFLGIMDAGWIQAEVDKMIEDQGATGMRYVRARAPAFSR